MNIVGEFLLRSALCHPEHTALIDGDVRFSYAELQSRVSRAVGGMRSLGLAPGDRVAYHGNNRWELVVTLLACLQGGFVVVPLNVMLKPAELEHILDESGLKLVLTTAESEATASALHAKYEYELSSYDDPNGLFARWMAAPDPGVRLENRRPDDVLAIFFTSGTTGKPKGAPLDHEFVSHLAASWVIGCRYSAQDIFLVTTPMFWTVAPMHCIIPMVLAGGTIVLMNRFDIDRCCELIQEHRVTSFFAVPTIYTLLIDRKKEALAAMQTLRVCSVAGAVVAPDVTQQFERLTGAALLNVYGATEAGAISREMLGAPRKAGCAGTLGGTIEAKLVDDAGNPVPPGQPGEVWARGFTTIKGYWQGRQVDPASLPDGWFRTGDIAVLEDGHFLRILDRKKDMIITGGANIYPAEVESVLAAMPGVRQCAVVGVPDRVMGELAVAYIVAASEKIAPAALEAFCRDRLSSYKVPRRFVLVDSIPMTPTGKVRKLELRSRTIADAPERDT
jgi:acyl-CoA synthetase (AMP-forming)/AMP-acid ligase II